MAVRSSFRIERGERRPVRARLFLKTCEATPGVPYIAGALSALQWEVRAMETSLDMVDPSLDGPR